MPSRATFLLATSATLLSAQAPSPEEAALRRVVDAYHDAVARKDLATLASLFHPDLVVFESGGVNPTRADYLDHHLGPELKELHSWRTDGMEVRLVPGKETAMALCHFTYQAQTMGGKQYAGEATETLGLVLTSEGWRIRHLHWSSRRLSPKARS